MRIYWFAINHKSNIREFSFVQKRCKILLVHNFLSVLIHVWNILYDHTFLRDRSQTTGEIRNLHVTRAHWILPIRVDLSGLRDLSIYWLSTFRVLACANQAGGIWTDMSTSLLVCLAGFPINFFMIIPWSIVPLRSLISSILYCTHIVSLTHIRSKPWNLILIIN